MLVSREFPPTISQGYSDFRVEAILQLSHSYCPSMAHLFLGNLKFLSTERAGNSACIQDGLLHVDSPVPF